jgi:hypothetical protein
VSDEDIVIVEDPNCPSGTRWALGNQLIMNPREAKYYRYQRAAAKRLAELDDEEKSE